MIRQPRAGSVNSIRIWERRPSETLTDRNSRRYPRHDYVKGLLRSLMHELNQWSVVLPGHPLILELPIVEIIHTVQYIEIPKRTCLNWIIFVDPVSSRDAFVYIANEQSENERETHGQYGEKNIFAFHKHKWNWWRFLSVKNTDSFRRSRMFAKFWTIDRIFEIILLFAFFDEFHWLNIGRPQAEVNGMNQCWRQYISSVIDSMWILKAPPMTATTEDLCLFRLPSFSAGRTAAAPLL